MSLHLPAQFSAKQAVKADITDTADLEKVVFCWSFDNPSYLGA